MKKLSRMLLITLCCVGVANAAIDTGTAGIGFVDPIWTLAGGPVSGITPHPAWVAAAGGTAWIGPTSGLVSDAANTLFTFAASTAALSASEAAAATLTGMWATDNTGVLKLNGAATGNASAGFGALTPFSITGFAPGVNVITAEVMNLGGNPNPTGLLVANSNLSLIPAPGAILLCSLGAGFVGWIRKRRIL